MDVEEHAGYARPNGTTKYDNDEDEDKVASIALRLLLFSVDRVDRSWQEGDPHKYINTYRVSDKHAK